jgi:hypothetical protein
MDMSHPRNSSCILEVDILPLDIFPIIHSFLSHHDYRLFLSCCSCFAYPLKYENVYYDIAVFRTNEHKLTTREEERAAKTARTCWLTKLKTNVKDPYQQIRIYVPQWNFVEQLPISFSNLCHGIHFLCINFLFATVKSLPSLSIFSSIYHLHLDSYPCKSLEGLSSDVIVKDETIRTNKRGIVELILSSAYHLVDVSEVIMIPSLKSVEFQRCDELRDISYLKDIEKVEIYECKKVRLSDLTLFHKQKKFSLYSSALVPFTPFVAQFKKVSELALTGFFEKGFQSVLDLEGSSIKHLDLRSFHYTSAEQEILPCISFVPGILALNLVGFNLSLWTSPLHELSSVSLHNCLLTNTGWLEFVSSLTITENYRYSMRKGVKFDVLDFSKGFQNLRSLKLSTGKLQILLIGRFLKTLDLSYCDNLRSVTGADRLRTLHLRSCPKLNEVAGLKHATTASVDMMEQFHNFSFLSSSSTIQVTFCNQFTHINATSTKADCIHIDSCDKFDGDITGLDGLSELQLSRCPSVTTLKGLGNVSDLSVRNCNLLDLEGIEKSKTIFFVGLSQALYDQIFTVTGPYFHLSSKITVH